MNKFLTITICIFSIFFTSCQQPISKAESEKIEFAIAGLAKFYDFVKLQGDFEVKAINAPLTNLYTGVCFSKTLYDKFEIAADTSQIWLIKTNKSTFYKPNEMPNNFVCKVENNYAISLRIIGKNELYICFTEGEFGCKDNSIYIKEGSKIQIITGYQQSYSFEPMSRLKFYCPNGIATVTEGSFKNFGDSNNEIKTGYIYKNNAWIHE